MLGKASQFELEAFADFEITGAGFGTLANPVQTNVTNEAMPLPENAGLCFLGMMKGGPFDIDAVAAKQMLSASNNPNGRTNSDVIRRKLGGQDIVKAPRDGWIIDFNDMPVEQAAQYELPFEYVRKHVKPLRDVNRDNFLRTKWWLHGRSRRELRSALSDKKRRIVTPEVSKYRIFSWIGTSVIPDHKIHVIASDDDYFFGILHSRVHEVWTLATCSWMGVGNDPSYSSSRTFETFPFPWPPGKEPQDDPRVRAIAQAARELVEQRDRGRNCDGLNEAKKKKRTLTNLYNARPTWLELAHNKLDEAVFAAYGWKSDMTDEEIVAKLLELNLERANGPKSLDK